ncbi:hypothetical protein PMAYCL1PPCAC_14764, partial [Pristionchus mayeri]
MSLTIPAGICIKYQSYQEQIDEMCACAHENCNTSSLYPASSGLPLDTRDEGMVDCATPSKFGGMRKCRGHVCFMMKQKDWDVAYGCIVYDERFMDKKYKLGSWRILHYSFYICDTSMCNAIAVSLRSISMQSRLLQENNGTCNCLALLGSSMNDSREVHQAVGNVSLVLGISVPIAFLVLVATIAIGYRAWRKQWPLPIQFISEKSRGRRHVKPVVINVVSPEGAHVKKK